MTKEEFWGKATRLPGILSAVLHPTGWPFITAVSVPVRSVDPAFITMPPQQPCLVDN